MRFAGKRHSEYLSRIQSRFENFQGPPLSVHSSRLFLQTDAIRMTPNLWNNTYTLFLFDHQLIYCKKDLIKRSNYIYKGRIFLDNCRVLNLADGKLFGVTLKNTLRLYCDTKNKWFDFSFRSSSSKARFLNTLQIERQFCGQSLFISELDGIDDDGHLSDRENIGDYNDYFMDRQSKLSQFNNEGRSSTENIQPYDQEDATYSNSKLYKYLKKSETLPKKTRKFVKEPSAPALTNHDCQTNSLGRKKFGYWVRRAKSTNSTPSHSPTHPMAMNTSQYNSESNSLSSTTTAAIATNSNEKIISTS